MRRTALNALALNALAPIVLVLVAAPLAGQAQTQADSLRDAVLGAKSRPPAAPVAVTLNKAYAEAYALRTAGVAKTAVSQTEDDITGALGFLCGLQPGQKMSGPAAARGYDPNGRFLGAKLSIALR